VSVFDSVKFPPCGMPNLVLQFTDESAMVDIRDTVRIVSPAKCLVNANEQREMILALAEMHNDFMVVTCSGS
jgi:hypothetical protein